MTLISWPKVRLSVITAILAAHASPARSIDSPSAESFENLYHSVFCLTFSLLSLSNPPRYSNVSCMHMHCNPKSACACTFLMEFEKVEGKVYAHALSPFENICGYCLCASSICQPEPIKLIVLKKIGINNLKHPGFIKITNNRLLRGLWCFLFLTSLIGLLCAA